MHSCSSWMHLSLIHISISEGIEEMSAALAMIMSFGVVVMGIFAFIFLFYTNSFLLKRRKKEIGLYNILGMEKKHIGKILIIENVIISLSSIILGLLCGIQMCLRDRHSAMAYRQASMGISYR